MWLHFFMRLATLLHSPPRGCTACVSHRAFIAFRSPSRSMRLAGSHLVLLTLLLWPLVTRAQPLAAQQEVPAVAQASHSLMDEEVGLPFFFEHFTPQEYRQHHQNWPGLPASTLPT